MLGQTCNLAPGRHALDLESLPGRLDLVHEAGSPQLLVLGQALTRRAETSAPVGTGRVGDRGQHSGAVLTEQPGRLARRDGALRHQLVPDGMVIVDFRGVQPRGRVEPGSA